MVGEALHLDLQVDRHELNARRHPEPDRDEVQDGPHPRRHDLIEHSLTHAGRREIARGSSLLTMRSTPPREGVLACRHHVWTRSDRIEKRPYPKSPEVNPGRPPGQYPGSSCPA